MNITINGLELGEGTDFQLSAPLQGFESAPIRSTIEDYSGRDGGVVTAQNYSGRKMTIPGFIVGSCPDHAEARRTLKAALPIRDDLPMIIETFDSQEYSATVRVTDFKADIIGSRRTVFKIELFAPDPNFYDALTENEVIIPRKVGGGFILPVVLPILFEPGSLPALATNVGDVVVYPTIEIVGTATNPAITKIETGERVEVDVVMGVSDVLVIDMYNRTVTLNGGSVLPFRTSDGDWFGLDPGDNHLEYITDNGSDTGVVTLSWRSAFAGI